jgi:WD40 repeat protein
MKSMYKQFCSVFQQSIVIVFKWAIMTILVVCLWQKQTSGEEQRHDSLAQLLITPESRIPLSAIDLSVKKGQVTGIWPIEWILREDIGLVVVSWDGTHLLTSGQSGVSVYDLQEHDLVQTVSSGHSSWDHTNIAAISADGGRILSGVGLNTNIIKVWESQTSQHLHTLGPFAYGVTLAEFHPQRPLIVTGAEDVRVWNAETYKEIARYPLEEHEYAKAITWHEERLLLASVSRASGLVLRTMVHVYDLERQQELSHFIPTYATPMLVSFIPGTDEILLKFSHGELQRKLGPFALFAPPEFMVYIQVRNWKTGHLVFEAKTSTPVTSAAVFPGGHYVVVSGNNDPALACQVWEITKNVE